jgi:hypothetical protein
VSSRAPLPLAVFNTGAQYIADVIDEFEKTAMKHCEDALARKRKGSARSATDKAGGPTDTQLHEEIAAGADALWEAAVEAFEFVNAQLYQYNARNSFVWPEGLVYAVVSG